MSVRGSDDALGSLSTFYAKDLLEAPSLQLVRGLFKLELSLGLRRRFLLQDFHQLHVKLVPLAHNYLLCFRLRHLTTGASSHNSLSLGLVSGSHDFRSYLEFRSSVRHETSLRLRSGCFTREVTHVLLHLLLDPW